MLLSCCTAVSVSNQTLTPDWQPVCAVREHEEADETVVEILCDACDDCFLDTKASKPAYVKQSLSEPLATVLAHERRTGTKVSNLQQVIAHE